MKKTIAIFLLFFYLFSATDIKELFKLNVLVEHYHETQQKDHSISVLQYLEMHYATGDFDDGDNYRDMQLPFKSIEANPDNDTPIFLSTQFYSSVKKYDTFENSFLKTNDPFRLTSFYNVVWHPPQSC